MNGAHNSIRADVYLRDYECALFYRMSGKEVYY